MDRNLSIVPGDKRPYRKIAQCNWGLTDQQMKGMHVHHRIPKSRGGTDDASNLFVCSPWFHKNIWHSGEAWIEWANIGGKKAAESRQVKRETDPEWRQAESIRASNRAKLSHKVRKGTKAYSDDQRVKALKAATSKRSHWTLNEYEFVCKCHSYGIESGYRISKLLGKPNWKTYANMLKCAVDGLTFEQATHKEEYLEERLRLNNSVIAHILDRYED